MNQFFYFTHTCFSTILGFKAVECTCYVVTGTESRVKEC